jgi:hypothetical protein
MAAGRLTLNVLQWRFSRRIVRRDGVLHHDPANM